MSFLVWQLIDSGFPAGGFAHSAGLEASMHHGEAADGAGVLSFARQALSHAGRSALPIVTAAYRAPDTLAELDELSDVFLSNPIANRASRAQGRAFLTCVRRSFPRAAALASIEQAIRTERLGSHYGPIFGAGLGALNVELVETQRAFLFMGLRGVASAAVRLGLLGSFEAQELQTVVASDIDVTIQRCGALLPADVAQTAPLIELCQSTHDRLYSRLFQS
jgi:urease accessory protein